MLRRTFGLKYNTQFLISKLVLIFICINYSFAESPPVLLDAPNKAASLLLKQNAKSNNSNTQSDLNFSQNDKYLKMSEVVLRERARKEKLKSSKTTPKEIKVVTENKQQSVKQISQKKVVENNSLIPDSTNSQNMIKPTSVQLDLQNSSLLESSQMSDSKKADLIDRKVSTKEDKNVLNGVKESNNSWWFILVFLMAAFIGLILKNVFGKTKIFKSKVHFSSKSFKKTKNKLVELSPILAKNKLDLTGGVIVTDAAITKLEQDRLGTGQLAKGLSLFLQNKNTQPPTTIAITGDWGCGKSSIMGMLKDDLQNAGYCPIWFNAWHHHQEEHLFGALLEHIRKDAIPPLSSVSGLLFRLRLLWIRMWRYPIMFLPIFITILFLLLWGGDIKSPVDVWRVFEGVDVVIANDVVLTELQKNTDLARLLGINASFAGLLLWLTTVFGQRATLFGLKPKRTLKQFSKSLKLINVDADPGLRYDINRALNDICWALGKKTLVVFIDDMDRCPPDQVLKVLECINFLSASPRQCYFVLGLALDKILPSISGEFSNVVDEGLQELEGEDDKMRQMRLKTERLAFAKRYLEKMINIEIHVPLTTTDQVIKLAENNWMTNQTVNRREDRMNRLAQWIDRRIFPAIIGILIFAGVIVSNDSLNRLFSTDKLSNLAAPIVTFSSSDANNAITKANQNDFGRFVYIASAIGGMFVFFLIAISVFARKTEINDSPDFIKAMNIWAKIITFKDNTPRFYKRVLNQLRLLAMRSKIQSPDTQLSDKQTVKLVLLRAVQEVGIDIRNIRNLINKLGLIPKVPLDDLKGKMPKLIECLKTEFGITSKKMTNEKNAIIKEFAECILEHQRLFNNIWPSNKEIELYEDLMKGITLR